MNRVLIMTSNLDFYKEINDYIQDINLNCKINVITNFEEMMEKCLKYEIDLIIIESQIKDNQLKFLTNIFFNNSNIIIIGNNELNKVKENLTNVEIISKYEVKEKIKRNLEKSIAGEYIEIDKKIKDEMKKIGFEMKNKGDIYLLKVIRYLKVNLKEEFNLEKDIYPIIANEVKKSKKNIKWNIDYAVNNLFDLKYDKVNMYFNLDSYSKPTTKYVISYICNKL